jgi:hypothetical protein
VKTWLTRARRRLSFANVTSAVALFVALGGTSYAAITLPRNSVGSAQLRTHAVKKREVAKHAVGRWEIVPNGVARSEIRRDAVGPSEIRRDAVGPSEIRGNAVSSDEVADGTLQADDLSSAGKNALAAMNGVTFRVASTAAGAAAGGNAKAIAHTANSGVYTVDLGQDVSACQYAATLGGVKSGTAIEPPATAAEVVTASPSTDAGKVVVTITDNADAAIDSAFHLLVAC